MKTVELPDNYYLLNFRELINYVFALYEDLLNEQELDFYHSFLALSEDAQRLYVRLLMRKGPWFLLGKLQYKEISDLQSASNSLCHKCLMLKDEISSLEEVTALMTKAECQKVLQASGVEFKRSWSKKELGEQLASSLNKEQLLTCLADSFVCLQGLEHVDAFKLLFFGNLRQDLSEFILRDLGLFQYESYCIDRQNRLFDRRELLDLHLRYYQLVEKLEDISVIAPEEMLLIFKELQSWPKDKALQRRSERLILKMARQLERFDELDMACKFYRHCKTPPARERRARIALKQGDPSEARVICEQIENQAVDEQESQFVESFKPKVLSALGIKQKRLKAYQPRESSIAIAKVDYGLELQVAEVLSNERNHCFYVENHLLCSILGLVFWDALFQPIKGAFTHPFQSRPHDLYDNEFESLRAENFNSAWKLFESKQLLKEHCLAIYRKKQNRLNRFIYWPAIDEPLLRMALNKIPPEALKAICQRIWQDPKNNASGLPDLVLFSLIEEQSQPDERNTAFELIEVKGPGDRLQKNQLRWMKYFSEHKIPHSVLHVQWQ